MSDSGMTRRKFVRETAIAAAGIAVGLGAAGKKAQAGQVDTSKILNYNPDMEYRRQGKTNLMFSAVCLGGHSRSNAEQRYEIVSRCIDAGINYIDACTAGEVRRDAKALRGRRDKMYLSLSHCGHEVRNENYRTSKKLLEVLDGLLKGLPARSTRTCGVLPATSRAAGTPLTPPARSWTPWRRQRNRARPGSSASRRTTGDGSSS